MHLLAAILSCLLRSILETLPSSEDEAGAFLSGLTIGFVLFWTILIVVTWSWFTAHGLRP
jgi:hypothetical protein